MLAIVVVVLARLAREVHMSSSTNSPGYGDRDGFIWLDGKMIPWRSARFHILTHAMHYGSSVFEGERAYNGIIFASRQHTERLLKSAQALDIDIKYSAEEIEAAKRAVLEINSLMDAYVRPVAWRGDGQDMGVASSRNPCRLAIATWPWGRYYAAGAEQSKGIQLDVSEWKRPSPETIPCHAKAAGLYMICTLAKHRAQRNGCSDALMLDFRGYVAEATGANIFFVRDGEVHTPLPDCFLNGITRQTVLKLLKSRGIKVHERHIMPSELEGFEQCWLTGTAAEVEPVGKIGDYSFEVGKLAMTMVGDYSDLVRSERN